MPGSGGLADAVCRSSQDQAGETTTMMQLDEILKDLNTRKANLTKIKQEISADKTKSDILDTISGLITKIEPLVKEATRLEDVKKNMPKFSKDVDDLNARRK